MLAYCNRLRYSAGTQDGEVAYIAVMSQMTAISRQPAYMLTEGNNELCRLLQFLASARGSREVRQYG